MSRWHLPRSHLYQCGSPSCRRVPPAAHGQAMAVYFNSTTLIIDDSYPNIAYGSDWMKGRSTKEYQQTTHGSACNATGCTFTFSFLGTAVEVFGTTSAGQNPMAQFLVDSLPVSVYEQGATSDTTYSKIFYSSPTLNAGQHTLTATVMNHDTLWVDYILYTPSIPSGLNVPLSLASDILALPSSASDVLGQTSPASSTPSPSSPSSSLSSPPPPSLTYASSPSPPPSQDLDPSLPSTSQAASSPSPPSSQSLPPSLPVSPSALASSSPSTPLTQSLPQFLPAPSSSSSAPPATIDNTSSSESTHSSPIGAIIGGAVGGVAVLGILLALLWWRRSKARGGQNQPPARRSSRAPSPFLQRRSTYHQISKARAMITSPWSSEHYDELSTPDTPSFVLERRLSRSYSHGTHTSNTRYAYNVTTASWDPALGSGESAELVPSLSERVFSRQMSLSDSGVSRRVYYDEVEDVPPPYSGRE